MKLTSFHAVIEALANEGVRYLIAGGLAVNAHGYLRYTKDVDLVIELVTTNITKTFLALEQLGYKPTVPVSATDFGNPSIREGWVRDKGMQVLQFWSDIHRETPIDVFVRDPFDFDAEFEHALTKTLYTHLPVRFVRIPTLIQMKELANRPQDRADIDQLRLLMNMAKDE